LQGSAATDLRQGGKLYDIFFCTSSQSERMKELLKLECLWMLSMIAARWVGRMVLFFAIWWTYFKLLGYVTD